MEPFRLKKVFKTSFHMQRLTWTNLTPCSPLMVYLKPIWLPFLVNNLLEWNQIYVFGSVVLSLVIILDEFFILVYVKFCFLGAHTLGFSHCNQFSKRIFSKAGIDKTLNRQYALQLRQMCPVNVNPRIAINMDPTTPNIFDNAYYKNLQQGKGLFTSDQVLFTDNRSKPTVNLFASNNNAFNQAFVTAMTKLGRVGVLTGNQGEIRRDCSRIN